VRSVLRRGEGEDGYLANLFFATSVVISALIIASCAPGVTLAYKTAATSTPAFARFVFDLGGVVIAIFSIAAATGAVAFALVVLATEVLPKWTGWLALLSAAGSLIASFVIFGDTGAFSVEGTAGFLGFGLFVIWSLGTAIAMLQKAGAPQAAA
jgi:hypothetical protein